MPATRSDEAIVLLVELHIVVRLNGSDRHKSLGEGVGELNKESKLSNSADNRIKLFAQVVADPFGVHLLDGVALCHLGCHLAVGAVLARQFEFLFVATAEGFALQ